MIFQVIGHDGGPHPIFHVVPVTVTTKQYNVTLTEDDPSLLMVYTICHTVKERSTYYIHLPLSVVFL